LDERIDALSEEIMTLGRQDKGCERLMTVPGRGPIISSAIVAAIGTGDAFAKGRDFGAWLGLVPKQMSTGDRTILGRHIETWQSLSAQAVRSGRLGRIGQDHAGGMGALRAQVMDRGGKATPAP
jgi:transposase